MNNSVTYHKMADKLNIPVWIQFLSEQYIQENCNGCGDKFTDFLVPDTVFGLQITVACQIHDLDYLAIIDKLKLNTIAKGEAKRLMFEANKRFYNNLKVLANEQFKIDKKGVFSLFFWKSEVSQARIRRVSRMKAIKLYKWAVDRYGWGSIERSVKR